MSLAVFTVPPLHDLIPNHTLTIFHCGLQAFFPTSTTSPELIHLGSPLRELSHDGDWVVKQQWGDDPDGGWWQRRMLLIQTVPNIFVACADITSWWLSLVTSHLTLYFVLSSPTVHFPHAKPKWCQWAHISSCVLTACLCFQIDWLIPFSAPDDILRIWIPYYVYKGFKNHEIVQALKHHYDTDQYNASWVILHAISSYHPSFCTGRLSSRKGGHNGAYFLLEGRPTLFIQLMWQCKSGTKFFQHVALVKWSLHCFNEKALLFHSEWTFLLSHR